MNDGPPRNAYLNAIGTAVPSHDVHAAYVDYACAALESGGKSEALRRLLARSQVEHRYAVVPFSYYEDPLPDTASRMRTYEAHALDLATAAIEALDRPIAGATHLIVTSCTGFYAPGLDLQVIERFGLDAGIERTIVGFMGCYAAMNALKLARHIVRSEARAIVLIVNIELCSLHLQRPDDLESALGFSIFADGCAASIVSSEARGLALERFASALIPESTGDITWKIGDSGFDMRLSLDVPRAIATALRRSAADALGGIDPKDVDLWAVHPGGRAVLDAVRDALALPQEALAVSREILRDYGNMSSATISFVLQRVLATPSHGAKRRGCAIAFGPGMICESMQFSTAA